jgi:hypothetical protein
MSETNLLDCVGSTLGRSVELAPKSEPVSVIRALGPDTTATMLTVVASLETRPVVCGFSEVIGTLRWGIGGTQNSADFDFILGTVMSVPASYIEVVARNVGLTTVRVQASVGYGSRPSSVPSVFRTVKMQIGDPASEIPNWSSVGIVSYSTVSSPSVTLQVLSETGLPMYSKAVAPGESFPVLGGAAKVNLIGTASTVVFLQYALVL